MTPIHPASPAPGPGPFAPLALLATAFVAVAAALAIVLPAEAAPKKAAAPVEKQARWSVTIEFERDASSNENGTVAKQKLVQKVQVAATLRSDGELVDFNPLDPADNQRRMAEGQRLQQQMQQKLAAQQQRPARPGAPAPMTQAEMVARAQQMQALCAGNQDCLMREAMKLSAAQSGLDAAGQARLQAEGEKRWQAGTHEEDDDSGPAPKYLHYLALGDCQPEVKVFIDEKVEGASADVQGMVPFTTTRRADGPASAPLLCAGRQMVVDTQAGVVWQLAGLAVEGAMGKVVSTTGGRTERSDGTIGLNWYEASDWIGQQLGRFPRQGGELKKLFPVTRGKGQVTVTMRWRFDEK